MESGVRSFSTGQLPSRPLDELPKNHCILPRRHFSFLPRKFRALITLPPLRPHVPRVTGTSPQKPRGGKERKSLTKAKQEPAMAVPGCYGDFCQVEFKYPQSLQDIETSGDAWSRTGRALCLRHAELDGHQLGMLLRPEELVACMEEEEDEKPPRTVNPKAPLFEVQASQVLEARSHPQLCQWLMALDWRIDPEDAALILTATEQLRADEEKGDMQKLLDVSVAGMRYRLRPVKVCQTCLSTYKVINQVITMVRHQRRDVWAKMQLDRRKKQEEKAKEDAQNAYIDRVVGCPEERAARMAQQAKAPPALPRRSVLFDEEVQEWMRDIPDSPVTAELMQQQWMKETTPSDETRLPAPPCSPETGQRRRALLSLNLPMA